MIDTALIGAAGRMGRMLVQEIAAAEDLTLTVAVEAPGSPALGADAGVLAGLAPLGVTVVDDLSAVATAAVVVEFTAPEVTAEVAARCAEHRVALVSGTTALSAAQRRAVERAATVAPVVWAPNMSVGVNALLRLVAEAARLLGPGYDIEVVEAHHRHKQDAPSGTASRLAEVLAEATSAAGALDARACYGRHGMSPRQPDQIGVHAVRGGDIVGEHTVLFASDGERLELVHRASSRQTFTRGAMRAVRWIQGRPAGLYDMADVLGLGR